jgi:hypothetical protein
MKRGSGAIAAAMLVVLAATPAFGRSRHHSSRFASPLASPLDSQEMQITNSPSAEPVIAPPVTIPAWANYDTPRPRAVSALPAIPTAGTVDTSAISREALGTATASGATVEGGEGKIDGAKLGDAKLGDTKIDGAKADTAIAAAAVPLTPEQNRTVAGPIQPSRTPGSILFDQTHDDSALSPTNWAVSVFKKRHEFDVYYKGRLFKKYDAVFGRNLDLGMKLWAQDRRTPEGVYTIIDKYPSARFHWFLRLNYPNLVDRVRYETMRVNGVVPVDQDGKAPEVGSAIGIHGTDVPILNAGHINWTTGCISVNNRDIDDLERLLPVGTVVIIKP